MKKKRHTVHTSRMMAGVLLSTSFLLGTVGTPAQALAVKDYSSAIGRDAHQNVPPSGKYVEGRLDPVTSFQHQSSDKAGEYPHPVEPTWRVEEQESSNKQQRSIKANAEKYAMSDLNKLSYDELVNVLVTVSWEQIPELFDFTPDSYAFYNDRQRVQAIIDALQVRGTQYSSSDSKGIDTLVEVLRSGYYLGYYHQELSYLNQRSEHEKVFPALQAIADNPNFKLGTDAQNEVVGAFGGLIGNTFVSASLVEKAAPIIRQYEEQMDTFITQRSAGDAVFRIMSQFSYILMWKVDEPTKKQEFYGKIDTYLNELGKLALHGDTDEAKEWVLDNGFYHSAYLGGYHSNPNKGNEVLTEALELYPYVGLQYMQVAKLIQTVYGGKDAKGRDIQFNKIREDAMEKYLPKEYTFDDGSIVMKTGADVTEEKVKRLYWAAKEVKAQFHRMAGRDEPMEEGNPDDILTMVLYNSPSEYKMNNPLYGYETDNGGMYIEGKGTFFTYERTPQQSTYTLEELFRHEFTHYLQGRYAIPGLWNEGPIYRDERLSWFEEGGAELFAGSTRTTGVLPRKSMVNNLIRFGQNNWYTASQTLHARYGTWDFYTYSYALQYHMMKEDWNKLDDIMDYIEANNVDGYDQFIRTLSNDSELNRDYHRTMESLVDSYPDLTVPLVSDDYLVTPSPKASAEIFQEIEDVAGLKNVSTDRHDSEFFQTFTLTGTYTGTQAQGEKQDWETMSRMTDEFLTTLTSHPWNGYKTVTAYFTNYRVNASNQFEYDVTFHGVLPEQGDGENKPPVIVMNGPSKAAVNEEVAFSSNGSSDPDGSIVSYLWEFGDGTTSSDANPTHVYENQGEYTVKLRVTDDKGAVTAKSMTIAIEEQGGEIGEKEQEPNNSFSEANPLKSNVELSGQTSKQDDKDIFALKVLGNGTVKINVTSEHNTGLNWVVHHEDDLNHYFAYPKTSGKTLSGEFEATPGTYYLSVYNFNGETIPYKVTAEWPEENTEPSETEPNNSFDDANTLQLGEEISGQTDRTDDKDTYMIQVEEEGVVQVTVSSEKDEGLNWVVFHEDDLETYFAYPKTTGKKLTGEFEAKPGKYYLLVYNTNNTKIPYKAIVNAE
ncbi:MULTISPECIES: collagenase [unclassified Brevibacillus]|uniref:collagenase n=1 Tax=unclassified Brevibacillus TaxID=2684853 RepID=UPI0035682694